MTVPHLTPVPDTRPYVRFGTDPITAARPGSEVELSGLPEDGALRVEAAMTAAYAETTRTVDAFAWGRWASWWAGRGLAALPAEPAAVCAYLTHCAEQGLSLATIGPAQRSGTSTG